MRILLVKAIKLKRQILPLFLVLLFTFTLKPLVAQALTEKIENYLFTCPISSSERHEQIVLKHIEVKESHGFFQYFTLDVEAGNENGAVDGQGQHLKYVQTLVSSQNSEYEEFFQPYRSNYQLDLEFRGHYRDSKAQMYLDLLSNGKYLMSLNGQGPLFHRVKDEYEEVLRHSEFYHSKDEIECFAHPQVYRFLSQ